MTNPWLEIPLTDYEGHMFLPEVAQASLLAGIFERMLREYTPASAAVLGCAGGNGFDRVNPAVTSRVVGVDINPDYIAVARERFRSRLPGLELLVADLQASNFHVEPVELAFAALLFEYVDVDAALKSIRGILKPGSRLVTVVQLPTTAGPAVTPSPFTSLQRLSPHLQLVSPELLRERAAAHGLAQVRSEQVDSRAGKSFQLQEFVTKPIHVAGGSNDHAE